MIKIKIFLILFLLICCQYNFSQTVEIFGKVESKSNVENIHVINNTAQLFTVTNSNGEFKISGKVNDTIIFTSIQHKPLTVILSKIVIASQSMIVQLEEKINELDEIVLGKLLTGDLLSDIKNSDAKPDLNFYDVGIQGYTGKPKTQNQRRLNEATTGGGIVPLNPIINAISGRTKKLKNQIKLEAETELLFKIKARLSKDFFSQYKLNRDLQIDFFFFCSEDKNFYKRCKNKSDIVVMEFLAEKYRQYIRNKSTAKN